MKTTLTTSNERLTALNSILANSKPYRAFVACAEARCHRWANDADLEAFEAKVAATLNWVVELPDWGQLWLIAAQHVLDGRLTWKVAKEPVVDLPTEEGDYFPDEVGACAEAGE